MTAIELPDTELRFYVLKTKSKYLPLVIKALKEHIITEPSSIIEFCHSLKKPDCFFIKFTGSINVLLRIITSKYATTFGKYHYASIEEIKKYYTANIKKLQCYEVGERVIVTSGTEKSESKNKLYGHIIQICNDIATIAIESSSRFPITYKVNVHKQLKKIKNDDDQ